MTEINHQGCRIIKETMLHLNKLPKVKLTPPADDANAYRQHGVLSISPSRKVVLLSNPPPNERWSLRIRGREYVCKTHAEALAFLKGKYTNTPDSLTPYLYDLQLFGNELPHDARYHSHPVVQHLNDHKPWCVHYRQNGTYFDTFAELCAYIEGRWGRCIGEESTYA